MKVFFRYHFREYFYYFLLFTGIFSFVITLLKGIITVQKIVELEPSFKVVGAIIFLVFGQVLSFIIPLSAFMSILFHLYRLRVENEILAFFSLGFSLRDFLRPFLFFCLFITLLEFVSTFWITPFSKRTQKKIKIFLVKKSLSRPVPEKRPVYIGSNRCLYIIKAYSEKGEEKVKGILILEKDQDKRRIFLAKEGSIKNKKQDFILFDGWGFFKKNREIEVLKFGSYHFVLNLQEMEEKLSYSRGEKTLKELKKEILSFKKQHSHDYYKCLGEYYYRFLNASIIPPLLLIAFFLGFIFKGVQKMGIFFLGVAFYLLFFIIYNFLISLGESGAIHPGMSYIIFYLLSGIIIAFEWEFLKKREGKIL